MKSEHAIEIDAPPATVWSVTEDVESWPQWNPTMLSVERIDPGPLDVGSAARIEQRGLPEARWEVTELERGRRFTWETRVRGIRMVATHELVPLGGGTRNVLRLETSGLLAVLLWPQIAASTRRALAQENAGLKARCES